MLPRRQRRPQLPLSIRARGLVGLRVPRQGPGLHRRGGDNRYLQCRRSCSMPRVYGMVWRQPVLSGRERRPHLSLPLRARRLPRGLRLEPEGRGLYWKIHGEHIVYNHLLNNTFNNIVDDHDDEHIVLLVLIVLIFLHWHHPRRKQAQSHQRLLHRDHLDRLDAARQRSFALPHELEARTWGGVHLCHAWADHCCCNPLLAENGL
mmetsp:Transcript_15422/g.33391  ORF Transcript_15422/g.33391 Transcript_15422/m.33391 type:complete len:205 (-) Transcript_15422:650-1264(-)